MLHPNFSDLAGLVLLVVFAVRSAVDHQLTWEKVSKWDIPEKNFRKVREWSRWDVCPNKKIPPIAASYHFGASLKASRARSSYFEQREIEDWSWRQKWPFLCALQLCCWSEDLKTNSLGSRPGLWKSRNSRRKPKRDRNGHFSILKGSGGKFQVRRLIFALNVLYYTPTHLGEVPHLNSNLTHYLYTLP